MKSKLIIITQILYLFIILGAMIISPFIAMALIVLHHFIVFTIIHIRLSSQPYYKFNWLIMSFLPFLLAISILFPRLNIPIFIVTNFLLLVTSSFYFFRNIKRWHRVRLILDMVVTMIILLGISSALFFSKIGLDAFDTSTWSIIITSTICIILSLFITLVTISSTSFRHLFISLKLIIFSYIFYIIYICIYLYTITTGTLSFDLIMYIPSTIAFSLMAIAITFKEPSEDELLATISTREKANEQTKSSVLLWISFIPIVLYFLKLVNITHLLIIMVTVIIYLLLNFYVQKTSMLENLHKQDLYLKDELEALIEDRTRALKEAHDDLYKRSTLDGLTGLYNRAYFINLIEDAIAIKDNHFSILFMDLDRFKIINDLHGHDMGDKVLSIIAKRFLAGSCKKCEYARLGGDEFAILFKSDRSSELEAISRYILDLLSVPIVVDDYQFSVGVSIGIARYPSEAQSVKQLLKYADIAMYHAKNDNKSGKFVLYSAHLIEQIERRNHIELLLNKADYNKDFKLYYQPKFSTKTRKLIGMEALIRWEHPTEGFISPAEFIPIAEETGIILELSDWIFETAMRTIRRFNTQYSRNLVMSINVSPLSLDCIHFLPNLKGLIRKIQVNPEWIELEITEHSAMNAAARMVELFTAISDLGVSISIDDFGTGYSSLSYIKRFDIDVLKIAKELIDNIETDENDRLIVNAIIMMAKGLNLNTIAEGVEYEPQLKILEELQCDAIQGYIFGKPLPTDLFEQHHLAKNQTG